MNVAGGLDGLPARGSGAALFIVFGAGGMLGLLTEDIEQRIGVRRLVQAIFPCSAVSLLGLGFGPDA